MPNFETYIGRYGECGVQAIVERIERSEGIRVRDAVSLEERWNTVMTNALHQQPLAA